MAPRWRRVFGLVAWRPNLVAPAAGLQRLIVHVHRPDPRPSAVVAGKALGDALAVMQHGEAMRRRPEFLLAATDDRLHQPFRAPAMPRTAALVEELRAAGVPAVVSGAGPTVLALTTKKTRDVALGFARRGWSALALDVDRGGASLLPLETRRE